MHTRKLRNYSARFEVFFQDDHLAVARMSQSPVDSPHKSDIIGLIYAPFLWCTNPACKKEFALPSISRVISSAKGHTQHCRHCHAPLPIGSVLTRNRRAPKAMARDFRDLAEQTLTTLRADLIAEHANCLRTANVNIEALAKSPPIPDGPTRPGSHTTFVSTCKLLVGSELSFPPLNANADYAALATHANLELHGLPWCYVITTTTDARSGVPGYALTSLTPMMEGPLAPGDTLIFSVPSNTERKQ